MDNIINTLKNKNYYGLDIDLEYIYPADKEKYNAFLRKTVSRLKPLGYVVTTALATKTSGDLKGLLYEAHDYPVHGLIADHVILMTYEWGYTSEPAMAVAPINQVKKILDYAVTVIPSKKIFMGIPNYGYDWTLPYVKGSKATALGNVEAVDLARKVFASIQYDYVSQAPFFNYYSADGKRHVVWFEDARSMNAKLRTANAYKLGGVNAFYALYPFASSFSFFMVLKLRTVPGTSNFLRLFASLEFLILLLNKRKTSRPLI